MAQSGNIQYAVHDKIVHPRMGPGVIVGVEHRELMEGFSRFYVVHIFGKRLTVRIPVRKADELGIRLVMTKSKLEKVMAILGGVPEELPADYKQRQSLIQKQIRTGQPKLVAKAVRDLYWHGERAHLTKGDSQLLQQGKELLADEMAVASDGDLETMKLGIESALQVAVASRAQS